MTEVGIKIPCACVCLLSCDCIPHQTKNSTVHVKNVKDCFKGTFILELL